MPWVSNMTYATGRALNSQGDGLAPFVDLRGNQKPALGAQALEGSGQAFRQRVTDMDDAIDILQKHLIDRLHGGEITFEGKGAVFVNRVTKVFEISVRWNPFGETNPSR